MSSQQSPAITAVQQALARITDVYYCTGTVQLNASQSVLFYRSLNGEPRFIDFANPSETELQALAEACSPASFGRNQEDILDENYRKAGKMDTADFSTQFSPWDSGVFKTVVETLFNDASMSDFTLELYKLNVYGPGSFFKAHVDTPRSDKMFGSLVVVLPTPHTGGSLLFRHHSTEYTFDSAVAVSGSSPDAPHAAFAAFFSDVEHEVTEVTSGYRVTLTYNLYHAATPSPSSGPSTSVTSQNEVQTMSTMKNALTSLLSAPDVLPEGALLAFGLSHEYPFSYHSTQLSDIGKHLKGLDALLLRVCEELNLNASVKAIYRNPYRIGEYGFVDRFVQFPQFQQLDEQTLLEYICDQEGEVVIGYDPIFHRPVPRYGHKYFEKNNEGKIEALDKQNEFGMYAPHYHNVRDTEVVPVVWVKPLDGKNWFQEKYIFYGNEATLSCAYGQVCLAARVKPASERGSSVCTDD